VEVEESRVRRRAQRLLAARKLAPEPGVLGDRRLPLRELVSGAARAGGARAHGVVYGFLFLLVELSSGIVLNREVRVGKDFHLVHSGNIKIHPDTVIGDRVGIMHDVTLGSNTERGGAPILGNDVFIGAGAKVLGNVRIGDGARRELIVIATCRPARPRSACLRACAHRARGAAGSEQGVMNGGGRAAWRRQAQDRDHDRHPVFSRRKSRTPGCPARPGSRQP
jgi:acetyltransferase-like isoleucine patch superfamily enzyme